MFAVSEYSPDNLASVLSEQQDNNLMALMGGSSYEMTNLNHDEMLNYTPGGITPNYPNPAQYPPNMAGLGVSQSWNPVWYVLAAAALGYIFFVKEREHGF